MVYSSLTTGRRQKRMPEHVPGDSRTKMKGPRFSEALRLLVTFEIEMSHQGSPPQTSPEVICHDETMSSCGRCINTKTSSRLAHP
jgi:hypothetical protein